jgi:GNAT superfamily N-acetyltransferase
MVGEMIRIQHVTTDEQIDFVREMMSSFLSWHRREHKIDTHLIEQYFDASEFEEEVLSLPGKYSPPGGRLLIAYHDGKPAGCVAMKEIDFKSCEMKRMFVYPLYRGKGVGRALADEIIREAKNIGYKSMLLDTSIRQTKARDLYKSLGFKETDPYYSLSEDLVDWLVFMELKL